MQNRLSRDFALRTAHWDLRAGMFSALEVMRSNPGISQSELSLEVGLDKSAMVPLVDDLEKRGWVKRARSAADRRRYELSVTPEGCVALDKMFKELAATEDRALAALTDAEREIVNDALDKVYRAYVRPDPSTPS